MESTNNSTRMQLVTTESQVTTLEKENSNLRRDKDILTDHVADLQRQVRRNTHCSVKNMQSDSLNNDIVATKKIPFFVIAI